MHETATGRRWFHFRLSTIFLVIVIGALCVGQFQATREVLQTREVDKLLREENTQLRAEAGHLLAADPLKVSVLELPRLDPMTWRWKVYLPKGNWSLRTATNQIPETGFVSAGSMSAVSAEKQFVIEASVRKGADGQWVFVTRHVNSTLTMGIGGHALVAAGQIAYSTDLAGKGQEQVMDPDQGITLLRLRCHKFIPINGGGSTSQPNKQPCDGLLIWLERNKAAKSAPTTTGGSVPPKAIVPPSPAPDSD